MLLFLPRADELRECLKKPLRLHGLREVRVHARLQRALHVLVKGIGRHGDDGDPGAVGAAGLPDRPGSAEAVQNRHAYVHQDRVEGALRMLQKRLDRKLDRPDAATIPIIALTANAFDEDVQRSLQAGMNAHLTKPVETEHLFQTLGELIYEAEHKNN